MIPTATRADVGVIVGRFQVHQLHAAHDSLIRSVSDTHKNLLIVLGLSRVRVSHRNPLDFEARRQMLLAAFPKATILYIKDEPSDVVWSSTLDGLVDAYVSPAQTVCLYGGRDSFLARYHGTLPTCELEPPAYVSATDLRKTISKSVKGTEDFRAGVIWASANGYPKVFPTVDVAIYRDIGHTTYLAAAESGAGADISGAVREWLLVRKPGESLWRLPGGFVQPSDTGFEMAARREVQEETGVALGDMAYVGSFPVDDWRYREEADKILTTLFRAEYQFGALRPADDVSEAKWVVDIRLDDIVAEHRPLVDAALKGGAR